MAKTGLPAIHPGEFLAETLEELGFSQAAFARAIGVSPMRISHVVKGARFTPSFTRSPSPRRGERRDDAARPWRRPGS